MGSTAERKKKIMIESIVGTSGDVTPPHAQDRCVLSKIENLRGSPGWQKSI